MNAMPGPKVFRCLMCRDGAAPFRCPADEVGAALMEAHLSSEHNINKLPVPTVDDVYELRWGGLVTDPAKEVPREIP